MTGRDAREFRNIPHQTAETIDAGNGENVSDRNVQKFISGHVNGSIED